MPSCNTKSSVPVWLIPLQAYRRLTLFNFLSFLFPPHDALLSVLMWLFQTATSAAEFFQRDVKSMANKLTTEVFISSLVYFNCYTRSVSQQTEVLMTIQSDLRKIVERCGCVFYTWR
jgi:hypothetical protein